MPQFLVAFASWLASLFGTKVLAVLFRVAVLLAMIVILVAAFNGFISIIHTSLDAVSATVPDVIAKVWSWIMPSNAKQCIVVLISARISKFLFIMTHNMLHTKAKIIAGG